MKEYRRKYELPVDAFTMRDVERIYQLTPAPPKAENTNDYITEATQEQSCLPFLFFLHYYERKLNNRVRRFLMGEGLDSYDPVSFLDY